ncbi:unnamed protein product [Leuciscus chuanchicus]
MKQSNLLKFVSKRPRPPQEEDNADVQEPQPSVSKELNSSACDYINSAISPSPAVLHSLTSTSPTRQCTDSAKPRASTEDVTAPSDLSTIDDPVTQPKLSSFPVTTIAGKGRSFNARWYEKFPWLEYSISRDAVFCKPCRHFPEAATESRFIKTGFSDWKHLSQCCVKHEASRAHATALGRDREHERKCYISKNPGSIGAIAAGSSFVRWIWVRWGIGYVRQ